MAGKGSSTGKGGHMMPGMPPKGMPPKGMPMGGKKGK